MKVGVKYCGGCNARYDRVALIDRLQREFPAVEVVSASGREVDVIAVVCGCSVACAAHQELVGRLGKAVLTAEQDYDLLAGLLRGASATKE